MSATIRGSRKPLQWGTTAITGYVVEGLTPERSGKHTEVENEIGDVVADISNYGKRTDVTIEVIPEDSIEAQPEPGDVFSYGDKKLIIEKITPKQTKAEVLKWTIAGYAFDDVPMDS